MMQTKEVSYSGFKGYMAYQDESIKKPGVLIVHDWSGCNHFAKEKAKKIAELGYVGFAVDMYGDGRIGETNEEKSQLMMPLIEDRNLLKDRIFTALDFLKQQNNVECGKIAAMGFCFGGLCVLDLARHHADVLGVVSFHGSLKTAHHDDTPIKSKILALHGYEDPLVPLNDLTSFIHEMQKRKADWQAHLYGNAMHSFTNPEANDPNFGTVFNAAADKRSWGAMTQFFNELFL